MKEVSLGRIAGPFEKIPFTNFMQSPIGLVPKTGGKTHLIFHLSFNFKKKAKAIVVGVHRNSMVLASVKY